MRRCDECRRRLASVRFAGWQLCGRCATRTLGDLAAVVTDGRTRPRGRLLTKAPS